ncbi:MAG: signal recognition particle protein [Alphaproteobacteria bacterium]|nr:signal recognition particle protein [Alphaproteobacteria bacterium]
MFKNLGNHINRAMDRLTGRGLLTEKDVDEALRDIRIALLEADVSLAVAKDFVARVREKAIGADVVKSIRPGQMVVKIVHDELVLMLGSEQSDINLTTVPPAVILMVGLQGSGKTTSTAKLADYLTKKLGRKAMMSSVDIYRPAAQHQLEVLGKQINVETVPIIEGQKPLAIAERSLKLAQAQHADVLLVDTAGRLHVDEALMDELVQLQGLLKPVEILLVVDALTGQDAVNIAKSFTERLPLTGVILTRIDGDSRGGAALSMRAVTGCPVKFVGVGEKINEFEPFYPDRIASRILDMGDIVSLVEKAATAIDQDEAEKLAKRMQKGKFDLNDLAAQLRNLKKMGGLGGLMGMLPGMGRIQQQMQDANINDSVITKQEAILSSMTDQERQNPDLINASRKRRIAKGSGTTVQEINQLLKRFKDMQTMMKRFSKMDKKAMMRAGLANLMPK